MAILLTSLGTVICVLAVSYFFQQLYQDRLSRSNGCLPPNRYPHKDPVFGLDLMMKTGQYIKEHRLLPESVKRFDKYGRTHQSIFLGATQINSIQPVNIQAVFSTYSAIWGVGPMRFEAGKPFCGPGLITTDGSAWAHARSLIKPGFHKSNISSLEPLENHFQVLLSRIPKDGSTVDLYPLFSELYLDIASLFLFGESTGTLSQNIPPHAQGVLNAFRKVIQGFGVRILLGRLRFLYRDSKWYEACSVIHKFADHYVDIALEHRRKYLDGDHEKESQNRTLLFSMAEQTGDREDLRYQIIHAFQAAQENTGNLLANVFFLLSRHPSTWQKLREEVTAIGHDKLTWEYIASLKYVNMILHEAIRVYPVLPIISKVALEATTLPIGGGPDCMSPIYIPKGTIFSTNTYALHRDTTIWGPDATEFKPERWTNFKPGPGEYLPFGAGPRACLGQPKVFVESAYIIVRLLQEFSSIESRDNREWTGQIQITAKNAYGCLVSLQPICSI